MIHHGDCLKVMAAMEPESVDAIVTDPPYGLGFMGKAWDGTGIAFKPETWEAALRVAKPSAYLLALGGTRTVHRMTVAIEDAGWIIRDMLVWAYASGFPKSKASLKPAWEPIVMARKPGPLRMLAIDACRIGTAEDVPATTQGLGARLDGEQMYGNGKGFRTERREFTPSGGRWPANVILTDPIFDGGWDGVVGGGAQDSPATYDRAVGAENALYGTGFGVKPVGATMEGYGDSGTYSRFFLIAKEDRAGREPVLPEYAYALHRSRGECVKLQAWAGADLNRSEPTDSTSPGRDISEGTSTADSSSDTSLLGSPPTDPSLTATRSTTSTATRPTTDSRTSSSLIPSLTNGSTPAASSETANGGSLAASAASSSGLGLTTGTSPERDGRSTDAAAPATSPRSSSRNACAVCGRPLPRVGSHPTVKPVDLMRHLVRLVTPAGGTVLDPFLGSGTTGLAAEMEGFPWIGIEREAEYVAIAEARLNGTQKGLGLPA